MATTETTLDKPVEGNGLPEQQAAENSADKSDITTTASQDAADILSILDSFEAQQPTTAQLPPNTPLTAEEQDKLAQLLGDTKPKIEAEANEQTQISEQLFPAKLENKETEDVKTARQTPIKDTENKGKPAELLQAESTVVAEGSRNSDKLTAALDSIQNKPSVQLTAPVPAETQVKSPQEQSAQVEQLQQAQTCFAKQEQNKADGLLTRSQSQPEAVTNEDTKHLRSELTKISQWHESLSVQVQKLLKVAENSNADGETLEADLTQAHETICYLQRQVQPLQEKVEDYDNIVTELRAQLMDKITKLTTIHEKLQYEVSQRRKAEQMLRIIKSRLTPLTRCKSITPPNPSHI